MQSGLQFAGSTFFLVGVDTNPDDTKYEKMREVGRLPQPVSDMAPTFVCALENSSAELSLSWFDSD